MTEDIIIFDDGSIEAKVLEHELKKDNDYNIQKLKVDKYTGNIQDWIVHIKGSTDIVKRVFLQFCMEDYQDNKLYQELRRVESIYPNLRLIKGYEQATRSSIKNRAANYGLFGKDDPIIVKEPDIVPPHLEDKIQEAKDDKKWDDAFDDAKKHELEDKPRRFTRKRFKRNAI